mgnify:CR=1 FL=1
MKNYKENGLEILERAGTKLFKPAIKLGTYQLQNWSKYVGFDRIKLKSLIKGASTKKGSFAYVYILDNKSVLYIGQTVVTSRIFTPSSIGGFNKITQEAKIPSSKHGPRNVSTFFQVYKYLKEGHQIDVYLIESKENLKQTNEYGDEFSFILKPQEVELLLQNEYKKYHNGELPPMHTLHKEAYKN